MTEVDLLQRGPRLRRFAIATLVAIAAAVIAGVVSWEVIGEATPGDWRHGPLRAVGFFAGLAGVLGYAATYALLAARDRRRDFPSATVESDLRDDPPG